MGLISRAEERHWAISNYGRAQRNKRITLKLKKKNFKHFFVLKIQKQKTNKVDTRFNI